MKNAVDRMYELAGAPWKPRRFYIVFGDGEIIHVCGSKREAQKFGRVTGAIWTVVRGEVWL